MVLHDEGPGLKVQSPIQHCMQLFCNAKPVDLKAMTADKRALHVVTTHHPVDQQS